MKNFIKKFACLSAIIAFALIANLNPLQAARLVPGTVPEKVPLQPIPPDTYPNYSGSIDSHPADSESTGSEETPAEDGNIQPTNASSVNNPELPKSPISASTQTLIWLGAFLASALLAWLWYFLRAKTQKSAGQTESVFKFKK